MLFTKLIFVLLLCFSTLATLAADLVGISNLFKNSFWSAHYEERFCGKNIEKLITKSMELNLDLSNAEIVQITDSSGYMFGMVNALQAREGGPYIQPRRSSPSNMPGEKNWYFHVVLKVEGKILDYDFTNGPRILSMKEYMLEMFVLKTKHGDKAHINNKLKGYKFTTYPAEDYILRRNQRLSTSEIETIYKIQEYLPELF
jgi:hypothetical protein